MIAHLQDLYDVVLTLFELLVLNTLASSSAFLDTLIYFSPCSLTELNHSDHTGLTLYEALHTLSKFLTLDTPQPDR